MKIGLFGHGYWGRKIAREITQAGHEPVIVCQADDRKTILSDDGITHVMIATPIDTHFWLASAAIEAGKKVMCEKMLTPRLFQTESLIDLARDRSLPILTDFIYTFNPALVGMKVYGDMDITFSQWGRFRKENVETVLGAHALAVAGTVSSIKNAELVSQIYSFRDPHTEWRAVYALESGHSLKIRTSLLGDTKERRITTQSLHFPLNYDNGIRRMIDLFLSGAENMELTLDVARCLEETYY